MAGSCGRMMESPPAAPLVVSQAKLLFQFFVVPLDDPSALGRRYQGRQARVRRKVPQPVLRRVCLVICAIRLGPFDQQPLLRQRFAAVEIPVRWPYPHRRKTGLEFLLRALAPKDGLPSRGGEFRRKILGENRLVVRRTLVKFRRSARRFTRKARRRLRLSIGPGSGGRGSIFSGRRCCGLRC